MPHSVGNLSQYTFSLLASESQRIIQLQLECTVGTDMWPFLVKHAKKKKKKGLITSPESLAPCKLYLPLLFVSQKVQLLLHTRSHCGFLMHHASQRICCSNTIVVPLVSCLCWCTTADSVSSGQHSLSSHSSMATPARGGWFPPPLTPCRDCLLLYPGASPCAMLSGSKTLWESCHLIRLITIVVLDFT